MTIAPGGGGREGRLLKKCRVFLFQRIVFITTKSPEEVRRLKRRGSLTMGHKAPFLETLVCVWGTHHNIRKAGGGMVGKR